jgi:hypothetical protein
LSIYLFIYNLLDGRYASIDPQRLEGILGRLDTLYARVRTTADSTLDAKVLQVLTQLGIENMKDLDTTLASTFNITAVMDGFSHFLSPIESQGGDAPLEKLEKLWYKWSREVYLPDFLNGPITTVLKPRIVNAKIRREIASESRPEQVSLIQQSLSLYKIFSFYLLYSFSYTYRLEKLPMVKRLMNLQQEFDSWLKDYPLFLLLQQQLTCHIQKDIYCMRNGFAIQTVFHARLKICFIRHFCSKKVGQRYIFLMRNFI